MKSKSDENHCCSKCSINLIKCLKCCQSIKTGNSYIITLKKIIDDKISLNNFVNEILMTNIKVTYLENKRLSIIYNIYENLLKK